MPGSVSGACFVGTCSPTPPPFPPPAPAPGSGLCSPASSVLWRILPPVHHRLEPLRPSRCGPRVIPWPDKRSPGSRTKRVCTCWGLRPRGAVRELAMARPSVLPSASVTASAPRMRNLSRLNSPAHALPYRRFARTLAGAHARLGADVASTQKDPRAEGLGHGGNETGAANACPVSRPPIGSVRTSRARHRRHRHAATTSARSAA